MMLRKMRWRMRMFRQMMMPRGRKTIMLRMMTMSRGRKVVMLRMKAVTDLVMMSRRRIPGGPIPRPRPTVCGRLHG